MAQKERDNIELDRRDSDDKGSRLPDKRPKLSVWIYLAILVALLVHLFINMGGVEGNNVAYSTFLDYVEQGYVDEVTIVNDNRIQGTYTEEAVERGVVKVGEPQENVFGGVDPEARRNFVSTRPSDDNLVEVLREYNARAEESETDELEPVSFDADYQEDWLGSVLIWVVPLILFVALWLFLIRRMNPGSQVLNIGKNKAVLFDALSDQKLTFEDVAGMEEPKAEVEEIVEFLKSPDRFTKLGGKLPKGVLLVGPPGTGKTMLAKAVAGEAEVPFFSLSGSDFVEMFVGVGASRVRDLFKKAKEKAPCIIFIDEIDAIGRTRGRGQVMGGNDERENTLNQLLVEMDGFNSDKGVIIMAATNRPDVLDTALLRPGRFDRQILIDKPDRREREAIFKVHTRTLILGDDVHLEVLASQTPGFAGAEIANVANEAALLAARKDKDAIEMEDFEQAIDRVIAGLEKKNKIISPEERRVVAFHEAGHAIVGWFLEYTDPVVKVSIVPRGLSALGYAQYLPEERYLYSREALIDRMTMAIGGRVAEEIVFERITTGAQNDLQRITQMAYAMVVDYGMSERIGYVSFNLSGNGNDKPVFDKPYSDETARAIDEEVKLIIDEVRARARSLLQEKRDKLDAMAKLLLDKELLGPRDLVELLGARPHGEYVSFNGEQRELREAADEVDSQEDESAPEGDESEAPEEPGGDGMGTKGVEPAA